MAAGAMVRNSVGDSKQSGEAFRHNLLLQLETNRRTIVVHLK